MSRYVVWKMFQIIWFLEIWYINYLDMSCQKYQDCSNLWIATGICDEHAVLQNVTSFSWINAFFLILSLWKFKHIEVIGPVCQVINISNIPIKLFDFCKFVNFSFFSREKYLKQNLYTNINCRFSEKNISSRNFTQILFAIWATFCNSVNMSGYCLSTWNTCKPK